jgi:hypothetical protein
LQWESLAERETKWNVFIVDRNGTRSTRRASATAPIVANVANSFLRPTAFSSVE